MKRIDTPHAVGGLFTEGTPPAVPATEVSDAWLNGVQEEICNVIEGAGLVLDGEDDTQLAQATQAVVETYSDAHVLGVEYPVLGTKRRTIPGSGFDVMESAGSSTRFGQHGGNSFGAGKNITADAFDAVALHGYVALPKGAKITAIKTRFGWVRDPSNFGIVAKLQMKRLRPLVAEGTMSGDKWVDNAPTILAVAEETLDTSGGDSSSGLARTYTHALTATAALLEVDEEDVVFGIYATISGQGSGYLIYAQVEYDLDTLTPDN